MPFQYPLPGGNNVAEYQASALPWVTGSVAVTGSVTRHDFPTVTSWINIQNTSTSGVLEVGATQYGTLFETNVFQIPAGGSWYAPYRLVSLYTMAASGSASQRYQINAGLTGIARRDYPRIEDAVAGGVGSDSYTPLSEGTMSLWLDASVRSSLWQDSGRSTQVVNSGDPIGSWDDQSGNERHAQQTQSTTKRPTYDTTTGASGVKPDGVDDFLELPAMSELNACTIAVSYKSAVPGAATTYELFSLWRTIPTTNTYYENLIINSAGYNGTTTAYEGSNLGVGFSPGFDTGKHTLITTYGGSTPTSAASYTHYYDRAIRTSTAPGGAAVGRISGDKASLFARISSTYVTSVPSPIQIYEILVWPSVLSVAAIGRINAYLKNKWGTP